MLKRTPNLLPLTWPCSLGSLPFLKPLFYVLWYFCQVMIVASELTRAVTVNHHPQPPGPTCPSFGESPPQG